MSVDVPDIKDKIVKKMVIGYPKTMYTANGSFFDITFEKTPKHAQQEVSIGLDFHAACGGHSGSPQQGLWFMHIEADSFRKDRFHLLINDSETITHDGLELFKMEIMRVADATGDDGSYLSSVSIDEDGDFSDSAKTVVTPQGNMTRETHLAAIKYLSKEQTQDIRQITKTEIGTPILVALI